MVFTTQYEALLPSLSEDKAVMVRGLALPEEGAAVKVSVQDIVALENVRVTQRKRLSVVYQRR